jgi:cobalt-zinc-cadmium efflux system protein
MDAHQGDTNDKQRYVLRLVLAINVLLVLSLTAAGVMADSSGLIANALDNASDCAVYVVSLIAIGRSARRKSQAASLSGILLLLFGAGVLADAYRRFVTGAEPVGAIMIGMSLISSALNLLCVRLLKPLPAADVNIRAAETFSVNDFVANLGVLVAGGLVAWTGRLWPDLLVGVSIAMVAGKGGIDILRDARRSSRSAAAG